MRPPGCTSFKKGCTMHVFMESVKTSTFTVFIVYLSFLLDNVLLTVVVPIIPDYLFSNVLNNTESENKNHIGLKSLSPLQSKYETLEVDNGLLGALLASKAFVQLAFTPLIGYIIGIVGCNLPLLLGSCNMFLAAILFAYGHSYGMLVLARALHGSASAAIAVSGMSLLAEKVPKKLRPKFMPVAFGGIALGVLLGYPLGGACYQLLGKPAPFLLIAFFIGLNIALQILCVDESDECIQKHPVNCMEWANLLKDYDITIVTGAVCICTSTMAILEPCIPLWLLAKLNPPPSRWQLGAVFIPDSVGYFLGSHFAGLLPVDSWRIAFSAMVLAGLSACSIPLCTSVHELAIPHFGLGLGVGALDAALVPMLANLVDIRGCSNYGPVYALQQASVCLAYFFGPLLGGQAVHKLGFPWLIRLTGLLNILYCPLLFHLEVKKDDKNGFLRHRSVSSYYSLEQTSYSSSTKD